MTIHQCPYCPALLPNAYAKALHLAEVHHAYENGEYVEGKTERLLTQVGARVLELLIHKPETRNPKNWPLWTFYLQRYGRGHILVYDAARQGWMINQPDGVLKEDGLKALFAEIETARRRRQDYQRADRLLYHDSASVIQSHICILPNEKDQLLAEEKYVVMRNHYGAEARQYSSDTYTPGAEA